MASDEGRTAVTAAPGKARRASSRSKRMRCAHLSSTRPAAVRRMPRPDFSNSAAPQSASRRRMLLVSAGCERCSRTEAWPRCCSSAMVSK